MFSLKHMHARLLSLLLFRSGTQRLGNFRQFVKNRRATQPQLVVNRRITADHGSRGDVAGDATLSSGDDTVTNLAVTGDTDLSGQNHVVADLCRPGKHYLRAYKRVYADFGTVAHRHQIVYFRPATDSCLS